MNVFEDLIEELKEQNLLESTVIENKDTENYFDAPPNPLLIQNNRQPIPETPKIIEPTKPVVSIPEPVRRVEESVPAVSIEGPEDETFDVPSVTAVLHQNNFGISSVMAEQGEENLSNNSLSFSEQIIQAEAELQALDASIPQPKPLIETELPNITENFHQEASLPAEVVQADAPILNENLQQELPQIPDYEQLSKSVVTDIEFYRRRANEEVTSLQIVEHIMSAIEKEQMKVVPNAYDDLPVSMALHDFLQAGNDPLSEEHTQAEFKLMQETERWYSALAERDKNIAVGDLRRFTENAKPALSPQALISLARFYRNSPFSEAVRGKFDMVITKLVTREVWDDTRELVFTRDELVKQLEELYADWSSIPLYEQKEDDSDVLIAVLKFEDFIHEATNTTSLEELIRSDFFNRIRKFKETTSEKFFAPLLASAAIECNVVVGNCYVHLISQERLNQREKEIEEKYNFILDQPVSDTVSKTLQLVELLKEKKEPPKPVVVERPQEIREEISVERSSRSINAEREQQRKKSRLKVNKWLLVLVIFGFISMGGLYTWAEFMTPQLKPSPNVKRVDLEGSSLKEYFKTARISREIFYAVAAPTWDNLGKEVKGDILKKMLLEGRDKGYNKINVLNGEGKMIAYASEKEINLNPK